MKWVIRIAFGAIVGVVGIFLLVAASEASTIARSYADLETATVYTQSKDQFKRFRELMEESVKEYEKQNGVLSGQILADAATDEWNWYTANVYGRGKRGGVMYCYWYDSIKEMVENGKTFDRSAPLPTGDAAKAYGWYSQTIENKEEHPQWCAIFTSSMIHKAGFIDIGIADYDAECNRLAAKCALKGASVYITLNSDNMNVSNFLTHQHTEDVIGDEDISSQCYQVNKEEFEPQPGDIILVRWSTSDNKPGGVDHVGVVTKYDKETGVIYTVDGNRNPSPDTPQEEKKPWLRIVKECEYQYDDTIVVGFVRFDFSGGSKSEEGE